MIPLLADISDDARWLLEALLEDSARMSWPAWAGVSAFHLLRTREPQAHPGFGTAILQWQRMVARFGPQRAPRLGAEAFLALPRTTSGNHVAARILELWVRHVPLPVEVAGRITAVDHLPQAEAALVAEELALGAHEGGQPSLGVLKLLVARKEAWLAEGRALAALELLQRRKVKRPTLAGALAPGLLSRAAPALPDLTARLLGGLHSPLAFTPERTPAVEATLLEVRRAAAGCPAESPAAAVARRIVACLPSLTAEEVLALSEPGRAGEPSPEVRLPDPDAVAAALASVDEPRAVQVALAFPALAGAVERGRALPGLTAWRAAREPDVPLQTAHRARASLSSAVRARWDALAGGALPTEAAPPPTWPERLAESLRGGTPLERGELLAAIKGGLDLSGVLFDSPGGPGLLGADGQLQNGLRTWPAPEWLAVTHPVELFDAERLAWQARLTRPGVRSPLNQLFREVYRPGGRELGARRITRLRGTELRPAGLELLARRGWFPTLAPADVPPELELGGYRARLLASRGPAGPRFEAVELSREGVALPLQEVPARLFSELWRDVDEALALGLASASFVPSPARAELMRTLGAQLGLHELRVEADHLGLTAGGKPLRITLHNARPTEGPLVADAVARARAAAHLPFEDDGGLAALLLGRLLVRLAPEDEEAAVQLAPPREGS